MFGCVSTFVKDNLFNLFSVSVIDELFDGIQGLLFSDMNSGITFITYSCYLASYGSPYGYMSTDVLAHLITQLYINSEIDMIYIFRDFNGRKGSLKDVIDDIDFLPQRQVIDDIVHGHGEHFVTFALDCKLCSLNGHLDLYFKSPIFQIKEDW